MSDGIEKFVLSLCEEHLGGFVFFHIVAAE